MTSPLAADLDRAVDQALPTWYALRRARVFITGGTGFVGSWLLETLLRANDRLSLEASAVVLTRDPNAFARKAPHLATHPAVTLVAGDIRALEPVDEPLTHVIHGAFASSQSIGDPREAFDTIVDGTRRSLNLALQAGARRFLLVSSGAVYGPQPPTLSHVSEDFRGGPDCVDPGHVYGEAKRAAEMLCALHAEERIKATIARCFTFVGPYLPLDAHFAAGNFIRDGLNGGPIVIAGDGTAIRSYLYASDLAVWLWTILVRGRHGRPYNVGSEDAVSIADLARAVSRQFDPPADVHVAKSPAAGAAPHRYVPSTERARTELGLDASITLDDALARTVAWRRAMAGSRHA